MSYASLFVGREKCVRCGSLCNERTLKGIKFNTFSRLVSLSICFILDMFTLVVHHH